jgi:glutamyl-Q tRNA(Asp) synthetase
MSTQPSASGYVGRFAPSPTGPLHLGSLVAAVASHLDARAHGGQWLLRIEDIDEPRTVPGADRAIIDLLARFGMHSDQPVIWQSERKALYRDAFERLERSGHIYPCGCSRREIADSRASLGADAAEGELLYPGTCRNGLEPGRMARAWRLRVDGAPPIRWFDRAGGLREETLAATVGDFVIRRADGLWAYQLAVVVDDALQGVTDVVRGADLTGSTARQIYLQQRLGFDHPRYLHVPLVCGPDGRKLSKQNGAEPLDSSNPVAALNRALSYLDIAPVAVASVDQFWQAAVECWLARAIRRP